MTFEEILRTLQTLRRDQEMTSPAQNKRAGPPATDPVADLIPNHCAEEAEDDGVSEV
jgi:hypothetical protein